jgi:hypothetical protein
MTFYNVIDNIKESIVKVISKINNFKKLLPGITDNIVVINGIIFPLLTIVLPFVPSNIKVAILLIQKFDEKILEYLEAIEKSEDTMYVGFDNNSIAKLTNATELILPDVSKKEVVSATKFMFNSIDKFKPIKDDILIGTIFDIDYIVKIINGIKNKFNKK